MPQHIPSCAFHTQYKSYLQWDDPPNEVLGLPRTAPNVRQMIRQVYTHCCMQGLLTRSQISFLGGPLKATMPCDGGMWRSLTLLLDSGTLHQQVPGRLMRLSPMRFGSRRRRSERRTRQPHRSWEHGCSQRRHLFTRRRSCHAPAYEDFKQAKASQ